MNEGKNAVTGAGNAPHYVRIKLKDGKRFIVRNPKSGTILGAECVTGIETDKFGEEIVSKGYDERRRIIDFKSIKSISPLRMNLKYGELEDDTL